jgi:hypothetical protein
VTRLIEVNSSEISDTGPDDWIVDSGANAYITPFKSDLRLYVETKVGQVKGFSGNLTTVIGKGSMTLMDRNGNWVTLQDVCYCPQSEHRILSFMKFRLDHHADFKFTGWTTFMFKASNGFEFHGRSINKIMHTSLSPQPEINVVTTRRTETNDDIINVDDFGSSSDPELHSSPASLPTSMPAQPAQPLVCTPRNLWHLRFGHASTTALRKLRLIKSSFDSRTCNLCLCAKKTRRPFPSSESKAEDKLERVH